MNTTNSVATLVWMVLSTMATAAWSDEATPLRTWPVEVVVQGVHGTYLAREHLGQVQVNQDSGALTGARLQATLGLQAVKLGLAYTRLQGGLVYQGFTQLALPLHSTTQLQLQRLQLRVEPGQRLALGPGSLGVGIGLETLQIERAIAATPRSLPTTETLRLNLATVGADWQLSLPTGARLRLDMQWHEALDNRMAVDTFGALDRYHLVPQRSGWAAGGVSLRWPLGQRLALQLSVQAETLRIGPGDGVPVYRAGRLAGLSSYPGSRQRLQTGAIGLALAI